MKRIVARHLQSDANKHGFATDGWSASLTAEGWSNAPTLGERFCALGIDLAEPIAVSQLVRSQQSAYGAGFDDLRVNPLLNEASLTRGKVAVMREIVRGEVPPEAIEAGEAILENLFDERACIGHALRIIGMFEVAGTPYRKLYGQKLPNFGDVVTLEI
jgi:Histidine phosphatase superfamily (branch 1)